MNTFLIATWFGCNTASGSTDSVCACLDVMLDNVQLILCSTDYAYFLIATDSHASADVCVDGCVWLSFIM